MSKPQLIIDLIPPGFRCPLCHHPRPNPHQWARTCWGDAICRSCLHSRPDLMSDPLELFVQRAKSEARRLPVKTVAFQRIVPLVASECARCQREKTRRLAGYCNKCRFELLRESHGGYGAIRLDERGRCFVIFKDDNDYRKIPREAYYAWGPQLLPLRPSEPSTQEVMDAQIATMWERVGDSFDDFTKVALRYAGKRYCEEVHDAAVEAACRASLTYDGTRENAEFGKYLNRVIKNATIRALAEVARRKRKEQPFDDSIQDRECPRADFRYKELFGIVQSAAHRLDSLGLTEFERVVLTEWVVEGLSQEQIGIKRGVVKSTVCGWITRIKAKCEGL